MGSPRLLLGFVGIFSGKLVHVKRFRKILSEQCSCKETDVKLKTSRFYCVRFPSTHVAYARTQMFLICCVTHYLSLYSRLWEGYYKRCKRNGLEPQCSVCDTSPFYGPAVGDVYVGWVRRLTGVGASSRGESSAPRSRRGTNVRKKPSPVWFRRGKVLPYV